MEFTVGKWSKREDEDGFRGLYLSSFGNDSRHCSKLMFNEAKRVLIIKFFELTETRLLKSQLYNLKCKLLDVFNAAGQQCIFDYLQSLTPSPKNKGKNSLTVELYLRYRETPTPQQIQSIIALKDSFVVLHSPID